MSIKETKRKGFNFFRSYFDVYNELPKEDKLQFIDALLNKQFLGAEPTDLKGMAKFAWISQQHSINEQVKGYEDKTKTKLPLSNPPTVGVNLPPTEQVEVKEEVKGEGEVKEFTPEKFLIWFNETRTKYLEIPSNCNMLTYKDKINLTELTKHFSGKQFNIALLNLCNDQWANENNMVIPKHFLDLDNFNKYVNIAPRKPLTREQKKRQNWGI